MWDKKWSFVISCQVIVEKDGHRDSFSDDIEAEINGEEAYYDKTKSFFDQISCDSSNQPSPEV